MEGGLLETTDMLEVSAVLSSRSRTLTAPLLAPQVDILPCCHNPGRKPPRLLDSAMPAKHKRGKDKNIKHFMMTAHFGLLNSPGMLQSTGIPRR